MKRLDTSDHAEINRRFSYAHTVLTAECGTMRPEIGDQVVMAALFTVLREIARDSGMAPCQYQMYLIDELALVNEVRRAGRVVRDASDPS